MERHNLADRATRLTITEAAELAQVSTKTLTRDRDAGKLTMFHDGGTWYVTVGALIDAGRYTPSTVETVSERLGRGRLEARVRDLEAELAASRREAEHSRELLRQATQWIEFLQGLVTQREEK